MRLLTTGIVRCSVKLCLPNSASPIRMDDYRRASSRRTCYQIASNCGMIPTGRKVNNQFRENTMSRMFNAVLPATLLLSALALSACASNPEKVPVAEPAPVAAVAEPPVPETKSAAPAPAVVAEQPAASAPPAHKPVIRKTRKIAAKHAPPPPPVIVPAPVVQAPPVAPPPSPPVTIAAPVEKMPQPGFLERYWLWLLGLGIIIAAVFAWLWRGQGDKH